MYIAVQTLTVTETWGVVYGPARGELVAVDQVPGSEADFEFHFKDPSLAVVGLGEICYEKYLVVVGYSPEVGPNEHLFQAQPLGRGKRASDGSPLYVWVHHVGLTWADGTPLLQPPPEPEEPGSALGGAE